MESVTWSAPEWRYAEKTARWYMFAGAAAALMILIALWQNNILFVIFIVLAGVVTFMGSKQPPKTRTYSTTDDGLAIDNELAYKFEDLEAFAVVNDSFGSPYSELVFRPKRRLGVYLKFLVPDENAPDLTAFLETKLAKMEYEESTSETLMRSIGL